MFGYYDPESLARHEGRQVMNFINASDLDDVTRIVIDTREKAQEVIVALGEQKQHFIAWLGGGLERVSGSLRISEKHLDEGVMATGDGRMVPIKMDFTPTKGQLPLFSLCVATGVREDGALRVAKMIMQPIGPSAKPGDPVQESDKKMD